MGVQDGTDGRRHPEAPGMRVACALRYHPALHRALNSAVQWIPPPSTLNISVMPSWRNALPAVQTLMNRYDNRMGREVDRYKLVATSPHVGSQAGPNLF